MTALHSKLVLSFMLATSSKLIDCHKVRVEMIKLVFLDNALLRFRGIPKS